MPTFQSPVVLPADPASSSQAATKNYVDAGDATKQPLDSDLTTISGLTATTDNFMVAASSAWASRTPAQAKTSLAITESDVSGLVTDLAAKAPVASPTFTGTLTTPRIITPPVTLSDAATILVDASLGNVFTFTVITTGRAVGAPSNPTDTQKILFRLRQDGTGSKTLTWNVAYSFGSDITAAPTLSTAANKVDYVGFIYDSTNSKWHLLSYARGY